MYDYFFTTITILKLISYLDLTPRMYESPFTTPKREFYQLILDYYPKYVNKLNLHNPIRSPIKMR